MMAQCYSESGHGGTSPEEVAEYIAKNYGKEPINLHLFTDGQVSRQSVLACDRILSNNQISFNKVYVHIYDTGCSIDLSVSTPFTRKCAFQIFANGQMVAQGSCREKLDLRQYEDLSYFLSNIDSLKSTIFMQNIGLVNEELRNELLDLKKKLLDSFMKMQVQSKGISYEPLLDALNKRDYSAALKEVDSLVKLDTPRLIEKAINDMVTACTSPHDFSLDLIKSSRFDRAEVVVDMPAEQVEEVLAQEKSFECPIMLDNDVPALLVIQPDMPILVGVDKDVVDDIINCPLNLWKYKDLVAKVASLLDHPVGCQSLKGGLFDVSPLTRRPVLGALTLGAAEDHCKATNWTLAQLFMGGKLLGNSDLWTILVYYIAKSHVKYLSENKTLMDNFECHIKFRLSQHKTNLSLSGLPNYPMIKVPVAAALWYCVASGDIYAEKNHSQDRLRALVGIGEILMHVLDLLELPYDKEYTINRLKIWRLFGWMMSQKLNKSKLVDLIRSYYQNYIYLEDKDRFIFLDGPQPIERNPNAPILPDFTREFSLEVLVYSAGLVDPSKRIGDIVIKKVISPLPIQYKKNYGYPENWTDNDIYERDAKVPICPLTLRPYFIDQVKRKEWKLCVEETWGCPLDKTISARYYYIRFVIDNLKFPESIVEFIEYMYDKQRNRQFDPVDTLPQYTETIVRSLLKQMAEAMKAHQEKLGVVVTPQEFIRIVEQSVNLGILSATLSFKFLVN